MIMSLTSDYTRGCAVTRYLLALLLALIALIALPVGGTAHAQSDEEEFDPLFVRQAGPFDVAVRWLPPAPQVGFINIAVKPTLSASGESVGDARIRLIAQGEDRTGILARIAGESETDFEVVAVNSPASPEIYRATLKFEEAGNWVLRVNVSSPTSGTAEFESPIVILPAPIEPGAQGAWAFLGIVIVLSAGGVYVAWSIRKAQAARQAHQQGPR